MIKVLIADDESSVRQGICQLIKWENLEMTIVGQAKNGQEALELSIALEPDIVLTDIRMPIMDGLTFTEKLKVLLPNTKVIIMTGFDDFEYTKKAISLKIDEYLLKPVGLEELSELLIRLKHQLLSDRRTYETTALKESLLENNLFLLQNKFIKGIIHRTYENEYDLTEYAKVLELPLIGPFYQVLILSTDDYYKCIAGMSESQVETYLSSLQHIMMNAFSTYAKVAMTHHGSGHFICILNTPTDSKFYIMNLCKLAKEYVYKSHDITFTACIGNVYASIGDLSKSYQEAKRALNEKIYKGNNSNIHIQDLENIKPLSAIVYPMEHEKRLLESVHQKSLQDAKLAVDQIFQHMRKKAISPDKLKQYFTRLILKTIDIIEESGINLHEDDDVYPNIFRDIQLYDTIDSMEKWFSHVLMQLIDASITASNVHYHVMTINTIDYIRKYFKATIHLNQLAEFVHVTPNYLNRIFKQDTGQNVMEWLNSYRIEQSKALLKEGKYSASEIATLLGYSDYKHYAYNFKNCTGKTITEFKKTSL